MVQEGIIAYDHFSFIQQKSPEVACSPEVTLFTWFDIRISFKDLELDPHTFQMNKPKNLYWSWGFNMDECEVCLHGNVPFWL